MLHLVIFFYNVVATIWLTSYVGQSDVWIYGCFQMAQDNKSVCLLSLSKTSAIMYISWYCNGYQLSQQIVILCQTMVNAIGCLCYSHFDSKVGNSISSFTRSSRSMQKLAE